MCIKGKRWFGLVFLEEGGYSGGDVCFLSLRKQTPDGFLQSFHTHHFLLVELLTAVYSLKKNNFCTWMNNSVKSP